MGEDRKTVEAVLRAATQGDEAAFMHLLEQSAPHLRARIGRDLPRRFQSVLSADDVLQQTFVDAYRDRRAFAGSDADAFERWLWAIARRNLLDAVRSLEAEKRGGGRLRLEDRENSDGEALLELLLTVSGPSRTVSRQEAARAVEQALAALPTEYRRCVAGLDLEGRSIDAVAAELGRSKGACYMMRARALRLLREFLGRTSDFL